MPFRSYDSLRLFEVAARHQSFTAAAEELNLTKGAVSYRINQLEEALGFPVFTRRRRGLALTEKGERLWRAAEAAFRAVDREIAELQDGGLGHITIGMATYFAARWLSPRLMNYIVDHPRTALRLQPLVDLIDLRKHNIDMAIRWGKGEWTDLQIEPLFPCPAFPTAGTAIAKRVAEAGLEAAWSDLPLLHDRDGSTAWQDWHEAAGLPYVPARDGLVIPDPNVRVQAVIDGQGVALNDDLVNHELAAGQLHQISPIKLSHYGYYLAYPKGALDNPALNDFRAWILHEANPG